MKGLKVETMFSYEYTKKQGLIDSAIDSAYIRLIYICHNYSLPENAVFEIGTYKIFFIVINKINKEVGI